MAELVLAILAMESLCTTPSVQQVNRKYSIKKMTTTKEKTTAAGIAKKTTTNKQKTTTTNTQNSK